MDKNIEKSMSLKFRVTQNEILWIGVFESFVQFYIGYEFVIEK